MSRPPVPLTIALVLGTYAAVTLEPSVAAPFTTALVVLELLDRDDR